MWSSAWYVWRATATRHVTVRVGLGAILGAGIALATVPAGGASRTSGTYDRFARSADLADVVVDGGDESGAVLDAIAAMPEVVDSARVTGLGLGRARFAECHVTSGAGPAVARLRRAVRHRREQLRAARWCGGPT